MKYIFGLALVALVCVGTFLLWPEGPAQAPGSIACTMEAKICPDGSAVRRTGPNCEFADCPVPTSPPVTATIPADMTLGVGQTGVAGTLSVTFNKFVQDSRCPIDVQCIQAGAVNINVTFVSGTATVTKNMPSDEVPQEFGGYKISIVDIMPPRKSGAEIDPRDYKITFHVGR